MEPVVLISGFGPFGDHSANASWESVKLLAKGELERKCGVRIVAVEMPVVYDQVDRRVPQLWDQYEPMIFIHVGVSRHANKLTLETAARADGYDRPDCDGKLPACASVERRCGKIECALDVRRICDELNEKLRDVQAEVSHDAGRYLCEYIFFKSLNIGAARTLFVHVPDIDRPYSLSQTARGLGAVIESCVEQLKECQSNRDA